MLFASCSLGDDADVSSQVSAIIAAVRREGDAALLRYTQKFDGVKISSPRINLGKRGKTVASNALKSDMKKAYGRILRYHKQFADNVSPVSHRSGLSEDGSGGLWGRVIRPIERVGVYVPGGSASLFSTLLMACAAARAAGVTDIAVATPPPVADVIFAAAEIAGVDEIYQIGGAQAIAALAYGTKTVQPVDKIVGPGNRFVTEAKRQVFGHVGIESLAGPSEIFIISDGSTDANIIAADMIAQAEHDPLARSVLLTTSKKHAQDVQSCVESAVTDLPRRDIIRRSLSSRGMIVVCRNPAEMISLSNDAAPEHLEILVEDSWNIAEKITAAGAIFVGENASEVFGDYLAGPNHILPTNRTARFSAPLSARDFVSVSSVQWFPPEWARKMSAPAARMARAEGLEGHARAAELRQGRSGKAAK